MRRRLGPAVPIAAALATAAVGAVAAAAAKRERAPRRPAATYVIDHVTEGALAWIPWRGDWTPLAEGGDLPVGSLVQCLRPTTLRMHVQGRTTDEIEAPFNLTLAGPGMFRVYPDLARRIRLVESVDVDSGDVADAGRATGHKTEEPVFELEDAWKREGGVGMFLRDLKKMAEQLKPLAFRPPTSSAPMAMRNMVGELVIGYPKDGLVFFRGKGEPRSTIISTWSVASPTEETPWVEVYMWKRDTERGQPVMTTNAKAVPLTLTEPGGYFLQMSSPDRRFQSKPIYFVVE
jgi:hypothetical protein